MIRLFSGEDMFASYASAKAKLEELSTQQQLDKVVCDADEISADTFMSQLQTRDLFGSGKVILAKRLLHNKGLVEALNANFSQFDKYEILIWHDGKADSRIGLVKKLKEAKQAREFAELKRWEIVEWVASTLGVKRQGSQIAELLVGLVGTDRGMLQQELTKLNAFIAAGKELTPHSLTELVAGEVEASVWEFLDALTAGERITATKLLHKFTIQEVNEQYLISMLDRQLVMLLQLLQAPHQLKLHPFVRQKLERAKARFTTAKVHQLMQALLRLDMGIKQGTLDPSVGLLLYVQSW